VFAGKVGTGLNALLIRRLNSRFKKIAADSCPFADLPDTSAENEEPSIAPLEMKHCHWVNPEIVCQVRFTEWTRHGRIQEPVFLGLREDETAADVIREVP
jgi:bifunctional non-homologous end joining protein LigD